MIISSWYRPSLRWLKFKTNITRNVHGYLFWLFKCYSFNVGYFLFLLIVFVSIVSDYYVQQDSDDVIICVGLHVVVICILIDHVSTYLAQAFIMFYKQDVGLIFFYYYYYCFLKGDSVLHLVIRAIKRINSLWEWKKSTKKCKWIYRECTIELLENAEA